MIPCKPMFFTANFPADDLVDKMAEVVAVAKNEYSNGVVRSDITLSTIQPDKQNPFCFTVRAVFNGSDETVLGFNVTVDITPGAPDIPVDDVVTALASVVGEAGNFGAEFLGKEVVTK